jgi:hypothetical protein
MQYTKFIEEGITFEENTNQDDCGAFVIYLLACCSMHMDISNLNLNTEDSKQIGKFLRENFAKEDIDWNYIVSKISDIIPEEKLEQLGNINQISFDLLEQEEVCEPSQSNTTIEFIAKELEDHLETQLSGLSE